MQDEEREGGGQADAQGCHVVGGARFRGYIMYRLPTARAYLTVLQYKL